MTAKAQGNPDDPLVTEVSGGVLHLTLNRVASRNALDESTVTALSRAVAAVRGAQDVGAVLVSANGDHFSAGADLKEMGSTVEANAWASQLEHYREAFMALSSVPVPVVCAVQGYAVAGGLELALSCDIVIAADDARLGDLHLRRGLVPGGGATWLLSRALGPRGAAFLIMSGALLRAEEAHRWGLVQVVVPRSELRREAIALAQYLASRDPVAMGHVKRLVREAPYRDEFAGRNAEIAASTEYFATGAPSAAAQQFVRGGEDHPGVPLSPWNQGEPNVVATPHP